MPSIYDLLVGKTQDEYRMENPLFQAGLSLSQPMARPQTSAEALWIPALQGLLSGTAIGFGKQQADQTAYGDYRKNPLVAALAGEAGALPEAMPADWTANDGRQNLILKALQKQNADEIAQKEAEAMAKFNATYGPEATKAKAAQAVGVREALLPVLEQEQAMKGRLNPTGTKIDLGMGQVASDKLIEQKALADEAIDISGDLKKSGLSWAQLQASATFAGLDESGIQQRISNLADKVLRSRSGAAAPLEEQAKLKKIVAGDFSAGPAQIANLLEKFGKLEARNVMSKLKAGQSLKGGTLEAELSDMLAPSTTIPAGAVPTGRTMGGKPVYKLPSGELWAED